MPQIDICLSKKENIHLVNPSTQVDFFFVCFKQSLIGVELNFPFWLIAIARFKSDQVFTHH